MGIVEVPVILGVFKSVKCAEIVVVLGTVNAR